MVELRTKSCNVFSMIFTYLLLIKTIVVPGNGDINIQNSPSFSSTAKLQPFRKYNYAYNSLLEEDYISKNQSPNFASFQKNIKNSFLAEKYLSEVFRIPKTSLDHENERKQKKKAENMVTFPWKKKRSIDNNGLQVAASTKWSYEANEEPIKAEKDLERTRDNSELENHDRKESNPGKPRRWCRTRDGQFLPQNLFEFDTCAQCYKFEVSKKRGEDSLWTWKKEVLSSEGHQFPILVLQNNSESNHTIAVSFLSDEIFDAVLDLKLRENWRQCCTAAMECCYAMQTTSSDSLPTACPRTWDGWQCWGDAEPGTTVFKPCPSYSYIDTTPTCTKSASKQCLEDGSWFRRGKSEWSDYSSCGQLDNIRLRLQCHVCTLTASVVALIPALLIFSCYRQLHVHRITLHKQLFISLLFESTCSISFGLIQLYGVEVMTQNPPWCVALCLVRKYARLTNYMWYLCEGFYLHRLLASAFAEQRSLLVFYIIGWVFPIFPLTLYALLRGLLRENSHCWNIPMEGYLEWIFQVPPLLAILINLIFIVNIVRILLGKVRATHDCDESSQFRMAVRATLMVVPLFGLQYIVTIYRPTGGACTWLNAYHVINNVIDGSTGLVVSIIFCYSNSEVRTLLRRNWHHFQEQQAPFLPQRLRRSFRLRSLSTVQTTLVDMNVQNSLTRKNTPYGAVKSSSKHLVSLLKKSSTSPNLPSTENSIADSGNVKNMESPNVEKEIIVRFIDNNTITDQNNYIKRSPSCSGLLL